MRIHAGSSSICIWFCFAVLILLAHGQRRVGLQGFKINDTMWLDGGRYIHSNGSWSSTKAPTFESFNLTTDFDVPPGPITEPQLKPSEVPMVSDGIAWSNLVDRAWSFGGNAEAGSQLRNSLFRFEPAKPHDQWTSLDIGHNVSDRRPSNGAGCNVPGLQLGYYLGGMTFSDDARPSRLQYLHWLIKFDTKSETLSSLPVPKYVPVVNQSLVYLDTGNNRGVLIALGGYTEKNGVLAVAPLTSVFIFDIGSELWTEQRVTDEAGGSLEDEKLGFEPSVGIPRKRFNACATTGSAQDKTSHNIFLLGGQNETHAMHDTWILSFPSLVWIKLLMPDTTNGPKSGNSCLLLNSRYVLMFGGCYPSGNPERPCLSYSYDPLLYDITKPGWEGYTYHLQGYFVCQNISDIIGGDSLGGSPRRGPMFGNFSGPRLQDLFHPPQYSRHLKDYDQVTWIVLPILLCLPFILMLFYAVFFFSSNAKIRKRDADDWRPWALRYPYLLFLNFTNIALLAMVIFLYRRSERLDLNPEHWTGGLESAGTWTGVRFASRFIRSAQSERPPQGILSVYYNTETTNPVYSQKNSTRRLDGIKSWAFNYLPILIAVINGRIWRVLDDNIKKMDKYCRLTGKVGCTGRSSLCLNYHSFWTPLSIIQALRHRQWTVALSSTGSVLASIVIPVVQNYVFVWELYSGALLTWPDSYSWEVAVADPFWSKVQASLLSATLVVALSLLAQIPRHTSGLKEDPGGIASVHELVLGTDPSHLPFGKNADRQTFSDLCSDVGSHWFRLCSEDSVMSMRLETAHDPPVSTIQSFWSFILSVLKGLRTIQWLQAKLKPPYKVVQVSIHSITLLLVDYPHFVLFRSLVFGLWLVLLSVIFAVGIYIVTSMKRNAQDEQWNYRIPVFYPLIGVFIQSIFNVIEHNVRSLTVFDALRHGYQPPRILWTDYACGIPFQEIYVASGNGHHLLSLVLLASLATDIFTIFCGSLQSSSSSFGATPFDSDLTAATACTILIAFVFAVSLAIGRRYCRRQILLRPPGTLAALIPCLIFSPHLTEDLKKVEHEQGREAKVRKLEGLDRRYAFGVFKDGQGEERLGVERHYHHGPEGRSNLDLNRRMEDL